MASTKEFLNYVLDLLREVSNITYKKMMGEYILYKNNIVIGGVYDNRFLVKKTKSLESYKFKQVIPYPNAKAMYLIDIEDSQEISDLIRLVYNDLRKFLD